MTLSQPTNKYVETIISTIGMTDRGQDFVEMIQKSSVE